MYNFIAMIKAKLFTGRTRLRVAKLGILAIAASSLVGLGLTSTASATSLSMWPTFECYHYNNNTASITVDKLQVNDDDLTTFWGVELQRWNGARYVNYWGSQIERFTDSAFGKLEEYQIQVRVAPNNYYRAVDVVGTNDGRGVLRVYDEPIAGRYNSQACHT